MFAPLYVAVREEAGIGVADALRPLFSAITPHERLRLRCINDALIFEAFDLTESLVRHVLSDFDGVDSRVAPELRQPHLTLVSFRDLSTWISRHGDRVNKGIEAFCDQNDGEGWMLPETLRLADYGLGHDDRAREHQPVRECFGPRFYDWQLAQTPEESWRECHLHARNLLGPEGYQALLDELAGKPVGRTRRPVVGSRWPERKQRRKPDRENCLKRRTFRCLTESSGWRATLERFQFKGPEPSSAVFHINKNVAIFI